MRFQTESWPKFPCWASWISGLLCVRVGVWGGAGLKGLEGGPLLKPPLQEETSASSSNLWELIWDQLVSTEADCANSTSFYWDSFSNSLVWMMNIYSDPPAPRLRPVYNLGAVSASRADTDYSIIPSAPPLETLFFAPRASLSAPYLLNSVQSGGFIACQRLQLSPGGGRYSAAHQIK